ncbi:hypothetical protein [Sulfuricella sp.]|uniref:hypothetical protein n=1 Tax=Sulfuricella sp. TaxID=2099377 RepID=UPI002BB9C084|nr:hypothetical protein [Sulfuricella sp.]HUX64498.1 hypothetical protein [Sulfuricella sp.]
MFTAAGTSAWPGYLATGQVTCHDIASHEIPCGGSGQDAEYRRELRSLVSHQTRKTALPVDHPFLNIVERDALADENRHLTGIQRFRIIRVVRLK